MAEGGSGCTTSIIIEVMLPVCRLQVETFVFYTYLSLLKYITHVFYNSKSTYVKYSYTVWSKWEQNATNHFFLNKQNNF